MEESKPSTEHLSYLDVMGMRKEIKKLKKSIRAFMLLDRETWTSFVLH